MTEATTRRRALCALAAAVALAGCSSDDDPGTAYGPLTDTATTATSASTTTATLPPQEPTTTSVVVTEPQVTVTTEPRVATERPALRTAPPTRAGTLRIDRIVVFEGPGGTFSGRANVYNGGKEYLNGLTLSWRILAANGEELDHGTTTWPTLAPVETATVHFGGRARYSARWARVVFARATP